MAIDLIKEDGTGKEDANTYASLDDAMSYFKAHLYASKWFVKNVNDRSAALAQSTRTIDTYCQFIGQQYTLDQALEFPRSGVVKGGIEYPVSKIPKALIYATCELALSMIKEDRSDGRAEDNIKEISIGKGAVKLEMHKMKKTERIPDNVMELLSKWATRGNDQNGGGITQPKLIV